MEGNWTNENLQMTQILKSKVWRTLIWKQRERVLLPVDTIELNRFKSVFDIFFYKQEVELLYIVHSIWFGFVQVLLVKYTRYILYWSTFYLIINEIKINISLGCNLVQSKPSYLGCFFVNNCAYISECNKVACIFGL